MKTYVKPFISLVEIRAEERLSVCDIDGGCDPTKDTYTDTYPAGGNGIDDFITLS